MMLFTIHHSYDTTYDFIWISSLFMYAMYLFKFQFPSSRRTEPARYRTSLIVLLSGATLLAGGRQKSETNEPKIVMRRFRSSLKTSPIAQATNPKGRPP